MSPVTPGLIRKTLRKLPNTSAPGLDKISYLHLKELPSVHHFLATLYSKIILNSPHAPALWCKGELRLVHKGGDPGIPANFRPNALASTIGKLFHRIIASRLEQYLLNNGIFDSNVQKGFLAVGNCWCFEHIPSLNTILDNAKANGLPLSLTFIDLKNAFGSVPHKFLSDMLHHVSVPMQIQEYVADTKLTATKKWCTPSFQITRGIFQGDTLSPLLFLLCFNPIIAYGGQVFAHLWFLDDVVPAQRLARTSVLIRE